MVIWLVRGELLRLQRQIIGDDQREELSEGAHWL